MVPACAAGLFKLETGSGAVFELAGGNAGREMTEVSGSPRALISSGGRGGEIAHFGAAASQCVDCKEALTSRLDVKEARLQWGGGGV